jgi:serine protease
VMAAAGNHVRLVTAPASFGNCLAVAATGPGDTRWDGSSRGAAVDVAMPGSCVHNASFNDAKQPVVSRGNGTSYSVAHLAGAVALWLAHHGRDQLITRYGAKNVQAAFLAVLRWPGVCVVPADWDDDWGIGRVDLLKLLQAPLPPANELDGVAAFGATKVDAVERIAAIVGVEPVLVRTRLAALLGADTPQELATLLAEHEGELVYLAMVDDTVAGSLAEPGAVGAFAATPRLDGVSVELSSRLKR